jgi:cytochrome c-type biogenesis protein CcsB
MKITRFIFSPVFMSILLILFAVAMAVATFVENDFGPSASRNLVYNTKWFELILVLLAINLTGQLIKNKLFRRSKIPVALFHLSFILMITGAAITRYFGWEGTIHVREGDTVNECYSNVQYIGYSVNDDNGSVITEYSRAYSFTDRFRQKIIIGNERYDLVLSSIVPNAVESVTENPGGEPIISLLVTRDMTQSTTLVLRRGESETYQGISIGFESPEETNVTIELDSGNFFISSGFEMGQAGMIDQDESLTVSPRKRVVLEPRQIITVDDLKLVPRTMSIAGITEPVAVDPEQQNTGQNALIFSLSSGDNSKNLILWNRQSEYISEGFCSMDNLEFRVTLGSQKKILPFSLRLNDFILERYPGSDSPSGYKSDVTLIDEAGNSIKSFVIFMNNILKHKGFRFYQSSYDPDEQGTILSVNHDPAGMSITYTGYASLFLFIILSLIIKRSSFRTIRAASWSSTLRKGVTAAVLILIVSGLSGLNGQKLIPGSESADEFGKVLVQDQKGRTKPLSTLSGDILRKVSREKRFEGYTSMQVFLGLYFDFENWQEVKLIRVSNKELQEKLGLDGNMTSFTGLVDIQDGIYLLSEEVNRVYSKPPGQRNRVDKEIMKVDERVNIVYMIYRGDFMKIFPLKDGTQNWGEPGEAMETAFNREDSLYLNNIMPLLAEALSNNDIASARKISESVIAYQERFSGYQLPSDIKIKAEILYYKLGIFERLFPFYATTGLVMLILLMISVIRGRQRISGLLVKILGWILFAGFLLHTSGLALRWYISGHSPMSNGYESMIFISWVTLLAGFIFSRRSQFTLSATAILAGMTLMVAHLSFMDPEITNLLPVLQSYWLTLHVSVITGSYGFLGLGAILGLINLILITLTRKNNRQRITDTIDNLTVINFKTLTLGLYFLTIGTFLGAIWANESWGRYWGWDPKETWSLITIIVYTFVIHSRLIPALKDIYTFNLLSLFAFSSVLMTYFGVNYYLSGLHSYAGGDPVPVPVFVYITVLLLVILSFVAYLKYKRIRRV